MEDWYTALNRGDTDAGWDLFVSRYHRLVFATIRRFAEDYDDVMDVFAWVCEALREDDLRRLRAYHAQPEHRAKFSTWLVTVVRNLTIDWFRRRDGRRRLPAAAENLPRRQRRIFQLVFLEAHSHVEAFEIMRTDEAPDMTFSEFLFDLRKAYRAASEGRRGSLLQELHPPLPESTPEASSRAETEERNALLTQALASLEPRDRLAVELYVLEELPAAEVARVAGLRNAKAVYNRVYRALAAIRKELAKAGIRMEDI